MVAGIFLSGKGEVCVWFTLNQNQNQAKQNQNKTFSPVIPLCLESTEKTIVNWTKTCFPYSSKQFDKFGCVWIQISKGNIIQLEERKKLKEIEECLCICDAKNCIILTENLDLKFRAYSRK